MSSTQDTDLKTRLLQLECHFTWALNKNDMDLTDLLNRLEEQLNLDLGREAGVARTHSCMGFVKFLLGSNTEALSNFEKSVEITKSHGNDCDKLLVVVYGDLAWLYYHMGSFAECESYLNKLREIEEKYPSVPYAEVLGEKGWSFFKFSRKYYERAKECFRKALEREPDEGEWNAGLAIVLHRTEASEAVHQLRRAIDTNPDDDVLKVLLALRLSAHKKHSEAESLVEQALERSPEHPHVIRYVGKFFRNEGSVDRSIALLKRALEKVSNTAFIHHQLGLCYKTKIINIKTEGCHRKKNAKIKRAREQCVYHLEMATEMKTSFISAMSELALQYGEKREMSRAEEMFQNTFKLAKEEKDYQFVVLRYAEFQQYCRRCESAAIRYYTECLKINSKVYLGNKSAENLKRIAKKRLENNPKDGEAFGILGLVHKEKGEKQQAIQYFEKALSYEHNDDYLSDLCELRLSLQ